MLAPDDADPGGARRSTRTGCARTWSASYGLMYLPARAPGAHRGRACRARRPTSWSSGMPCARGGSAAFLELLAADPEVSRTSARPSSEACFDPGLVPAQRRRDLPSRRARPGRIGGGMKARIVVRLKPGILDRPGTTIRRALEGLGFPEVRDMRVGRCSISSSTRPTRAGAAATGRDVPAAPRQSRDRGLHQRGGGGRRQPARELTAVGLCRCGPRSRIRPSDSPGGVTATSPEEEAS